LSSRIIKSDIYRLLQVLFSEYFIDAVTELSPANVGTCLWCLESFAEKSEFSDCVDEVFTKKNLEQSVDIALDDARTQSIYGQSQPNETDHKNVTNV
jgi:hypothetical protein